MKLDLEYKDTKEVIETPFIQQTAFWSEVKKMQGVDSLAFDFSVRITEPSVPGRKKTVSGDLLLLLQPVSREHFIAYAPYGPEFAPGEELRGVFLEELSEALRPVLSPRCIMIRYDLAWESFWNDKDHYTGDGIWEGPPEKHIQEFRFNYNTRNWNLKKSNSDILPAHTIYMDLKKDEESLFKQMKPKTRYNIHLSERKGVMVRQAGFEEFSTWYALYRETAERNRFFLHPESYFKTVLAAKAADTASPAEVALLLAEKDGIPLAAMFLVLSGNRGTYLYGASSSQNRNTMATYALQWHAMQYAKNHGCSEYDFFGIAPKPEPSHPLYGLYRFKTGFGGEIHHRLGCWDYPLNEEMYLYYHSLEMQNQSYHLA